MNMPSSHAPSPLFFIVRYVNGCTVIADKKLFDISPSANTVVKRTGTSLPLFLTAQKKTACEICLQHDVSMPMIEKLNMSFCRRDFRQLRGDLRQAPNQGSR
jgi:hypothetical protein